MDNQIQTISSPKTIAQLCALPVDDAGEWMSMSVQDRLFVSARLDAMREILESKDACKVCSQIARRKKQADEDGWSYSTIYRLYNAFRKSDYDWRALRRNYCGSTAGKPKEFELYFREMLLQGPRKDACRAARRELINRWIKGESIPGYGTIYDWSEATGRPLPKGWPLDNELPDGWSYRSLIRIKPKSQYANAVAKGGYAAAHSYEPDMLLRDRSKLRFMEVITFDDVRIDNRCLVSMPGMKREIGYPLSVLALDVATGCDIAHCVKPRITRQADGTKFGIASEEVRYLILNIIENYGLPPYPITFLIENAAATLSLADELAIKQTFGDRIRIHRCGVLKDKFLENGFHESGGKPWFKGWVESFFHIFQTQLSLIDGASGNRYDNNPAQLAGREKYLKNLIALTDGREEIFEKLKLPLPTFEEISEAILEVLHILRHRKNHNLQGFDTVTEWRRDKFDTIHPHNELAALSDDEISKVEIFDRLESPAERVIRLASQVEWWRPASALYCHLYALKQEVKFTITKGGLTFKAQSLKRHKCEKITDDLVFESPAYHIIERFQGEDVLVYFDDDLRQAHLTKKGVYICSLNRKKRINIADEKAIKREAGRVHQRRLSDRNIVAELMPQAEIKLSDMRTHNLKELEGAGLLGERIGAARNKKASAAAIQRKALESFSPEDYAGEDYADQKSFVSESYDGFDVDDLL